MQQNLLKSPCGIGSAHRDQPWSLVPAHLFAQTNLFKPSFQIVRLLPEMNDSYPLVLQRQAELGWRLSPAGGTPFLCYRGTSSSQFFQNTEAVLGLEATSHTGSVGSWMWSLLETCWGGDM